MSHLAFQPRTIATALALSTIGLGTITLGTISAAPSLAIPFKPPTPKAAPNPQSPEPTIESSVEIAVPEPATAPVSTEPFVKSKQNLDYERLQEVMKAGDWAEANRLTSLILLNLGDKAGKGYLSSSDTAKLSCTELKTVDGLWNYYTGSRSSLSMQARIWRNMWGKTTAQDAKKFEGRLGWHKGVLNPNPKAAQAGHMPLRPSGDGGSMDTTKGGWIEAISDRLETCGMIAKQPAKQTMKKQLAKPKSVPKSVKVKRSTAN